MGTAWIDSEDYGGQGGRSPAKSAMIAVVLFVALLAAAAGIYWLIDRPSPNPDLNVDPARNEVIVPVVPVKPVPTPPQPVPEESLLKAPPPTCIEGRPTSARVPARDCV
jgi:hypothetical protein